MSLATWWSGDPRPPLPSVSGLEVRLAEGDPMLGVAAALAEHEVARRHAEGHRSYAAYVDGELAAYGWVATRRASIGELWLQFELGPGSRYLWDFKTLPRFQGRGIYPQLLGTIVERESPPATRLWIIHAPENLPSGVGIARAGFDVVAELSFGVDRRPYLMATGDRDRQRAIAGARLLGLSLTEGELSPCWRCGSLDCSRESEGGCACAIQTRR